MQRISISKWFMECFLLSFFTAVTQSVPAVAEQHFHCTVIMVIAIKRLHTAVMRLLTISTSRTLLQKFFCILTSLFSTCEIHKEENTS